jgi:tetratricopeptide (TPR) repeat protein
LQNLQRERPAGERFLVGLFWAPLTAESLRSALKKYEEALPLWRSVNDRAKEAKTLHNIGDVYDSLGEKPQGARLPQSGG